jgi:hypothetical protein
MDSFADRTSAFNRFGTDPAAGLHQAIARERVVRLILGTTADWHRRLRDGAASHDIGARQPGGAAAATLGA